MAKQEKLFGDCKFHIIPSIRELKYLKKALEGREEWILLSCCHIGNLRENVDICHRAGKKVIINHKLVGGLGADRMAFQLLKNMYHIDGVMGTGNTKIGLISREKMKSIRRIVLSDSLSVEQVLRSMGDMDYDGIELRPAYYAVQYYNKFRAICNCSFVVGGFVNSEEILEKVYQAGFSGTMTSCVELWNHPLGGKEIL